MMVKRTLKCSFCRRPDSEVGKLVAGPRVYICDRCVETAARIMSEAGDGPHPHGARLTFLRWLFRPVTGRHVQGPWRRTDHRAVNAY